MKDFKRLILAEANQISILHNAIHESYLNRNQDHAKWKNACETFHSYKSEIDPYIDRVHQETEFIDRELQEFVIVFLELDPMFFRSGYIKEVMLKKIKRAPLTGKQLQRLREIVLNAINSRPFREFKAYCRLASTIADTKLQSSVEKIATHGEGARKSRAKLVLDHINQKPLMN